jgi:hypothetical protein
MAAVPDRAKEISEQYDAEIQRGPDFAQYRRGSGFAAAPAVVTDRNACARIMFVAETIERRSWRNRKKGKHGGCLGRNALIVLRVLMFVVKKSRGRLFPSYDHLALLCRLSRRAVVEAVKRLAFWGFLTVHRRCKRVGTAFGARVVQDSNAYEYHLPSKGWGALAVNAYRVASECRKSPASTIVENNLLSLSRQSSIFERAAPSQGAWERERAATAAP